MSRKSNVDKSSDGAKVKRRSPADAKVARTWVIPLITAAILAVVFLMYYFVYVGARREHLVNRNFRALATLGEHIQQSVSIHASILAFCDLKAREGQPEHFRKLPLSSFLVFHSEDVKLAKPVQEREMVNDYLKFLAPTFELSELSRRGVPAKRSSGEQDNTDAAADLRVEHRNGDWELVLQTLQSEKRVYQGSLKITDLMNPLVASLPFDDVLLVSQQGFIVYHSKQKGPQFTTLRSLLQSQIGVAEKKPESGGETELKDPGVARNADPTWRSQSTNLTDVMLAGTRYKLFLQPILVNTPVSTQSEPRKASELVLCGLRSASALEWEALSLSYTFFIWFTAVFFVIWASYKVLKILFMNRRERLRLRELGALGLSLVLLTSVLTLSLLQARFRMNDDTDAQLQSLASRLRDNVKAELTSMKDQLTEWCGAEALADLKQVSIANEEYIRKSEHESPSGKDKQKDKDKPRDTPPANRYPFASNAFWTDDDRHQIIKWSVTQYLTPMIDVSHLPIFGPPALNFNKPEPFYLASVLPPNKLEYLATLGMKTTDCYKASTGHDLDISADVKDGFAFLSAHPLSLIDPILPHGYGFALVDETGAVLFHSDKTRNGRENLLMESDGNKELYAAVFGHTSPRSISVRYMGKDCRARVVPLKDIAQAPWSLIVFRDLTAVRTLNLQVMTIASTLLFLILGVLAAVISIWWATLRLRFAPEWLWPNRRRSNTYVHQIYAYVLLIFLFLPVALWASTEAILIVSAAVPYVAFLATLWCYRVYPPAEAKPHAWADTSVRKAATALSVFIAGVLAIRYWKPLWLLVAAAPVIGDRPQFLSGWLHRRPSADAGTGQEASSESGSAVYRTHYLAAALLLLLLIGVLVPMALFRASLDVERRLEIKQAQLHLASALTQRWNSVIKQREKEELSKTAWLELQDNEQPWHWIVPDSLTPAKGLPGTHPPREEKEHFAGWLRGLTYFLHHDYNDASAEMLGVIQDGGNPPDWSWDQQDSKVSFRWRGPHPAALDSAGDLLITSVVPNPSTWDGLTYAGILTLVVLAVGGLLFAISRKVFLFSMAPLRITGVRQVSESLREGRNVLILLPPVTVWHLEVPRKTLDVSELSTLSKWNEELAELAAVPPDTLVEFLHFEFTAGDPEVDKQKLVVLERLLKKKDTQIAVVMKVPPSPEDYRRAFPDLEVIDLRDEPFSWLKLYEGRAQELIWRECGPLPALWPLGAQLAKDLRDEAVHTEDTVASEILERADPYYRMIWNECSKDQKFVLYQLARDGLLNPTNGRAIRQMIRRGLITKDPQFRIANESFRRFLRTAATAELKREWVNESRGSGWGRMRGAFFTSMLLFGVFLLATQNALWQSAAAYVTTALGGLGTLAKLVESFRDKVAPEKADA